MKIEIWSDVVCPYCYIGKRHLEQALEQLPDLEVDITWRSFELNPNAPVNSDLDIYDTLAKKYGRDRNWAKQMNDNMVQMASSVGLNYDMDHVQPTNSFNAHQLIHLAQEENKQDEMKEALLSAYFEKGKHIGDTKTLTEIAEQVGIDKSKAEETIQNNSYSNKVMEDVEKAHKIGVQGVPFFYINEKYGLSGAQPVEVFVEALTEIAKEANS
ncbi:MAG: disulfide bond formation protein DsbA [Balneola sp.]|jgi:protein disulfide-isomerase|nr:disulfide bond formation protein DsbA [Balneola sp.]MBE77936.1 disulfide bond formation protein DsbA [Balneola sp.]HBX66931.1 disulfide bond formation protein DsbA [Balneolaceae bacterium]|tara:strand:+ start:122 stop:760 length:639 start_codon:yes stop_codon:yes gene_type:complete